MNPPSALHSAMSRDRKPFTYTPGGINLSEIKSQRMAERLMRNAMNPGVPEKPLHPVLHSAAPMVPVVLPNYNCLPVQVFPAMPANPKTLLRSRSNPDPRNTSVYKQAPPTSINNLRPEDNGTSFNERLAYPQPSLNNRFMPLNDYNSTNTLTFTANNSDGYTAPVLSSIYENSYKPTFEYAPVSGPLPSSVIKPVLPPIVNTKIEAIPDISLVTDLHNNEANDLDITNNNSTLDFYSIPVYQENMQLKACGEKETVASNGIAETCRVDVAEDISINLLRDINQNYIEETPIETKLLEETADIDNEQSEVKIIKKQVVKESADPESNENENGNSDDEAEMTVTLPTKKQGAKTETNVEVQKNTLPDGTIEEIKITTTKTTIDGRTEIKTRTEKTIIPKNEEYEEEVEEEEEEVEEEQIEGKDNANVNNQQDDKEIEIVTVNLPKENSNIIKTEERSEVTIMKKVAVVQEVSKPEQSEEIEQEEEYEDEEEVEVDETEPVTIVLKKQTESESIIQSKSDEEELEDDEIVAEEQKEVPADIKTEIQQEENDSASAKLKEEELQEDEEPEIDEKIVADDEVTTAKKDIEEASQEQDEDVEVEENMKEPDSNDINKYQDEGDQIEVPQKTNEELKLENTEENENKETVIEPRNEVNEEPVLAKATNESSEPEKEHVIPIQVQSEEFNSEVKEDKSDEKPIEFTIPIREPSIPLDKVEDIEIQPIGMAPIITKKHMENTEIITSTIDPTGGISRQTEYNKFENIVTVNRTTKILDQNYESITQQGIPTVKTYFPPPSSEKISTSPLPARPYQPVYCPEPLPERRHSLLLERLSMERQVPSDIYQYSNQSNEQTLYQSEPQSEVLTVSNVKPSTITNQQWYQQTQNAIYNNVSSNPVPPSVPWTQPKSPQPQQQYQPQQQHQPQQQYQTQQQYQSQPQYQPPQPQSHYQAPYQSPLQSQYQQSTTPQPQFQRATTPQPQFLRATTPQPQYQLPYTEPIHDKTPTNNYPSYSTKPTWVSSSLETTSTPYSYLNTDTTQSYQNTNSSTTQYSSGYVPPPWEQDSSYASVNNTSEKYYQEVPQTNTFTPTPTNSQGWKTAPPNTKHNKNSPIAYVPPAPNQSFVKPVVEVPRHPGRKTYYSEYERRYITVPESTYIPTETKYQAQPDPSPQYYYDNNEPVENVEPQWRKELREFTEKSSQTQTVEQISVNPPWQQDSTYAKTPSSTYNPTPTWSQTLRPQANRERSFESDYVSQEWPKANTLGRRRPLSTMAVSTDGQITDRVRGVSVDRYNPNNYQSPAEHPPVHSHTLTPVPHASYHNPNVPAYHARASAEPREQPIQYQQRVYREARASPLQSRSFKYLQWITGTEN